MSLTSATRPTRKRSRAALEGGGAREILEHVADADISPDGKDLAVLREIGRLQRLEFPIGRQILETDGWVSHPRISPDGKQAANEPGEPRASLGPLAIAG